MKTQLSSIFLGFALLVAPVAGLGQDDGGKKGGQIPAKDGDEIKAEGGGKKSGKVKVSDVPLLDLTGLPESPLKDPKLNDGEILLLKLADGMVPKLGTQVKEKLKRLPNLTGRITYLSERLAKLDERLDHLESGKNTGLATQKMIDDVIHAKKILKGFETGYRDKYFRYLKQTYVKEAADHFIKVYKHKVGTHAKKLLKKQKERRKTLGLPPPGSNSKDK